MIRQTMVKCFNGYTAAFRYSVVENQAIMPLSKELSLAEFTDRAGRFL